MANDNQKSQFKNLDDLILHLSNRFEYLPSDELKDLLFSLKDFQREHTVPKEAQIYIDSLPVKSLEILSRESISDTQIEGISKFQSVHADDQVIPPAVIIKGAFRYIIIYGEMHIVESILLEKPIEFIIIDINRGDPFKIFDFNPDNALLLIPQLEKMGIEMPNKH